MKQQRSRFLHLFRFVCLFLVMAGVSSLPVYAQQALPNLFSEADPFAPMDIGIETSPEVIRARWTDVDFTLVSQLGRVGARQDGDDQPDFTFNLFPDVTYPAYVQGVEVMDSGAVGVYGRVSDGPVSEFVLVSQGGLMHAYLQDGIDTYEVRYQNGGHLIVEVDSSVYPESLPPLEGPALDAPEGVQADAQAAPDAGDVIDVLGLYTPRAKNVLGGQAAAEAQIQASILSTNLGYANSGITQRVRLVGMEEVDYDEILAGKTEVEMWYYALSRLTFGGYGTDPASSDYLYDARAYRDAYGADLVFMLTDLPYVACGLGWMGGDPGDAYLGYSVVHWSCSGSTAYSVQHEMGHNMGACHDRTNTSGDTVPFCYDSGYSYGYWLQNNLYYTVMAYRCPDCVARINYWSNPNVYYGGYPTGVNVGNLDAAYNTLTLNNTRSAVGNYRQAVRIEASFAPSEVYDSLRFPRATLDVDAYSPDGSIVQVTYQAYYNAAWHTLATDTNPADGWAYTWNNAALGPQTISLKAIILDSIGQSRTLYLHNVPLQQGYTTVYGFMSRTENQGAGAVGLTLLPDQATGQVLEVIPLDPAELEVFMAEYWSVLNTPRAKQLYILMQ